MENTEQNTIPKGVTEEELEKKRKKEKKIKRPTKKEPHNQNKVFERNMHEENRDNGELKEESIVEINVGGKIYATTLGTLRSVKESMLASMFSGNYSIKKDNYGRYFIDRDGKLFRYILNYLRDGSLDLPKEEVELRQLYKEALFYQLNPLVIEIEHGIEELKEEELSRKHGRYAICYLGGYGKSSQVYTKETTGGFSETVRELNKLAELGYNIQGVCSGVEGNYYAILKTNEPPSKK